MDANLPAALELIRRHEGGYVNHPADPGGCTNLGITLATYRAHGHPRATCAELRRLTWEGAADIYRRAYWNLVRADELPAGVDLCVMDTAVNSGPQRAVWLLQDALGRPRGRLNNDLVARAWAADPAALIVDYSRVRLAWLRQLKTFRTFGRGWTRRVHLTRDAALELLEAPPTPPPPGRPHPPETRR